MTTEELHRLLRKTFTDASGRSLYVKDARVSPDGRDIVGLLAAGGPTTMTSEWKDYATSLAIFDAVWLKRIPAQRTQSMAELGG